MVLPSGGPLRRDGADHDEHGLRSPSGPVGRLRLPRILPTPESRGGAPRQELVPAGASGLRLCRYDGGHLKRARPIESSRTISVLAREFDALRPMPPGVYHCPADFAVVITAAFRYRDTPEDLVEVDTTGCQVVRNGQIIRWAPFPPGPKLVRQLLSYTGCRAGRLPGACA